MPRTPKKSKYKHVVIKNKRYYFYKLTWVDITGDSGHADLHVATGFMPSIMVTHAYLLNKDNKNGKSKYMMFEQYKDKFMIWQLHNRKEIVCFVAGFIIGAILI